MFLFISNSCLIIFCNTLWIKIMRAVWWVRSEKQVDMKRLYSCPSQAVASQPAGSAGWVSRLGQPAGSAGWVSRLGQPAGSTGWVSRLGQPAGSAGWVSRLGQPAGSAGWVSRLGQPAGSAGWVSRLGQPAGSAWLVRVTGATSCHLSEASIAARLSVFWNSARTSCFSSSAVSHCDNGPFPSAQRSLMSCRLAVRTIISSVNFSHWLTCLHRAAADSLLVAVDGRKEAGARLTMMDNRWCNWEASSVEMSSSAMTLDISSAITASSNDPSGKQIG